MPLEPWFLNPSSRPSGSRFPSGDRTTNELPFLVTQWLAHYGQNHPPRDPERQSALARIENAASELASAFHELGVYGSASRPNLEPYSSDTHRHATFSDVRRQWAGLSPNHLESLVGAVVSTNRVVEGLDHSTTNRVQAAEEALVEQARNPHQGRTLIDLVHDTNVEEVERSSSALHAPVVFAHDSQQFKSVVQDKNAKAARFVRDYLALKETSEAEQDEIDSLKRALAKQQAIRKGLQQRKLQALQQNSPLTVVQMDDIQLGEENCDRVEAQLQRKLTEVTGRHRNNQTQLFFAKQLAHTNFKTVQQFRQKFRDPLVPTNQPRPWLFNMVAREQGSTKRSSIVDPQACKAFLSRRLLHAATISAHMAYPVYCLRFDRTGRYFVTGADDFLAKVFYLGAAQSCQVQRKADGSRQLRCNYGANARGAVLVCTLRGHAGVINDIAVSSDNCFLATASEDGDCRIWGLRDGCPVAILRGHVGGANMVSWSTLTPYRLVTTAADGFARTWDIRKAALKRYGAIVGKRPEYLVEDERPSSAVARGVQSPPPQLPGLVELLERTSPNARTSRALPMESQDDSVEPNNEPDTDQPQNEEPQAPPAAQEPPNGEDVQVDQQQEDNMIVPGQFVANDNIDEGVRLISKLQHGSPPSQAGPGTRSRRSTVSVICVAQCPHGGHFATGSDDGICRIWQDSDDESVAIADQRASKDLSRGSLSTATRSADRLARGKHLLSTLEGHEGAVTDLQYSHAGDRILTASQKDGVVCIWSWDVDPAFYDYSRVAKGDKNIHKIQIRLTNPGAPNRPSRRRGAGVSTAPERSKISCDVAVWTHDDSRIITSQSCPVKASGSEIHPGSQYLFLWDGRTGQCLLGMAGTHTMQCSVVIPHPSDYSLVCTAGADGYVKIWDWESCRCTFVHKNTLEHGPVEPNLRGKQSGFLDGAFHHDGTGLVLTDDSGRVTTFDSILPSGDRERGDDPGSEHSKWQCPPWMKEQYFASDYYEMFYDTNGYCIERGSEQPPHLAPKGVRASHLGAPWPEEINEAFSRLVGPLPLPGKECNLHRNSLRRRSERAANEASAVSQATVTTVPRATAVHEYSALTTKIFDASSVEETNGTGAVLVSLPEWQPGSALPGSASAGGRASPQRRQRNARPLSSNYRWGDLSDLRRDDPSDDEEHESEDEDFQSNNDVGEESDTLDEAEVEVEGDHGASERMRRLERRRQSRGDADDDEYERPARRRRAARTLAEDASSDSDQEHVEYVGTNNTPSGPYVDDYNVAGHIWVMPLHKLIPRKWLCRPDSTPSYNGQKIYAPQLGDSVVYIPRAHQDIFSALSQQIAPRQITAPWKTWPADVNWPLVRCRVCDIRYRFPWKKASKICNGIVAILSLQVTGVPEPNEDCELPWPKPSFVAPSVEHCFEVSLFESKDSADFILPEGLFTWRLQCLEDAIERRNSSITGLNVNVSYSGREEDSTMISYPGSIVGLIEEEKQSDCQLEGSGFGSLHVKWENSDAESTDLLSPWDITVVDMVNQSSAPDRPSLAGPEKAAILAVLMNIQRRDEFEVFRAPVDESRYCDYSKRVEIPMCLDFINERVSMNYYGSKASIVADVRLIWDNCCKYNGDGHFLSHAASNLYKTFEQKVLRDMGEDGLPSRPCEQGEPGEGFNGEEGTIDQGQEGAPEPRLRRQGRSSLERLPPPPPQARRRSSRPTGRTSSNRRSLGPEAAGPAQERSNMPSTRSNTNTSRQIATRSSGRLHGSDATSDLVVPQLRRRSERRPMETLAGPRRGENGNGPPRRGARRRLSEDSSEPSAASESASRGSERNEELSIEDEDMIYDESANSFEEERVEPLRRSRRHSGVHSRVETAESAAIAESLGSPTPERRMSLRNTRNSARLRQTEPDVPDPTHHSDHGRAPSKRVRYCEDSSSEIDMELSDVSSPGRRLRRGKRKPGQYHEDTSSEIDEDIYEEADRQEQADQDEDHDEPPTPRSRRAAARNHRSETPSTPPADPDEDEDVELGSPARRTRSSTRNQQSRADSISREFDDAPPLPSTRQTRSGSRRQTRNSVPPSDSDPDDSEEEQQITSLQTRGVATRRNSRPATRRQSNSSKSQEHKRRAVKTQYNSSEESEEEDYSASEAEQSTPNLRSKRKRDDDNEGRRSKKERTTKTEVKEWPNINVRKITEVANSILDEMALLDDMGLFTLPVAEMYPELEREYNAKIKKPMDFRTIREDRLPSYQRIAELQADLVLTFENCMEFNQDDSVLTAHARKLLDALDEVFETACDDASVRLRR